MQLIWEFRESLTSNFLLKLEITRNFLLQSSQSSFKEEVSFIFNPWQNPKPTICLNYPNLRDFSFFKNFYSNSTLSNKQKRKEGEEIKEKSLPRNGKTFLDSNFSFYWLIYFLRWNLQLSDYPKCIVVNKSFFFPRKFFKKKSFQEKKFSYQKIEKFSFFIFFWKVIWNLWTFHLLFI